MSSRGLGGSLGLPGRPRRKPRAPRESPERERRAPPWGRLGFTENVETLHMHNVWSTRPLKSKPRGTKGFLRELDEICMGIRFRAFRYPEREPGLLHGDAWVSQKTLKHAYA